VVFGIAESRTHQQQGRNGGVRFRRDRALLPKSGHGEGLIDRCRSLAHFSLLSAFSTFGP